MILLGLVLLNSSNAFNCNGFARKAADFRGIVNTQTCQEAWIVHKCDNDLTNAKSLWVEGNMGETGQQEWTDDFKGRLWAWSTVDTADCQILSRQIRVHRHHDDQNRFNNLEVSQNDQKSTLETPFTKATTSCHEIVFCVFVLSMLIGFVLRKPRSTSSDQSDNSLENIEDNGLDSNFMV